MSEEKIYKSIEELKNEKLADELTSSPEENKIILLQNELLKLKSKNKKLKKVNKILKSKIKVFQRKANNENNV